MTDRQGRISRRRFLRDSAATALVIGGARVVEPGIAQAPQTSGRVPWYRRAYLWGQTNITEKDPTRYDIAWWREQWKRTQVQAVIINAGGIVAYYPSKFPLHHRAEFLGGRDLFGELTKAAALSETPAAIYCFRDRDGREIDFILEARDGRIVAIEVKASASPGDDATRHLRWLRDRLGDRFVVGIMLYLGEHTLPHGDRILAVPLSALWGHAPLSTTQ